MWTFIVWLRSLSARASQDALYSETRTRPFSFVDHTSLRERHTAVRTGPLGRHETEEE